MPRVKNDGKGVFKIAFAWWFRTYAENADRHGPYETRPEAMEALLAHLGFDVQED